MNHIINKLKSSLLFTFIISGILFGSIGIYAASIYYAKDISYESSDASWEVSNVNDAINSLYNIKNELNTTKTSLNTLRNIGNATEGDILSGKIVLVNGNTLTGTMANNGAVTKTLNAGGSYTIPAGYHNGNGYVDTSKVYNTGVSVGRPNKTQTLSSSYTFSGKSSYTFRFTFSGMTTVAGVTSLSNSYSQDLAPSSVSVSGNVVSVNVFNTSSGTQTTTVTVTAIGY